MKKHRANAEYQAKRRANETPEERRKRLEKLKQYHAKQPKKGEPPGRKPLSEAEPTVNKTITVTAGQVEVLQEIGDGVVSAGVRKLVDDYVKRRK